VNLPRLPSVDLLAELCRETATRERVAPGAVEKDLYLTRLIWALADRFENRLLLKGGTLLSKVDLGFHRMSEDVDMVMPLTGRGDYKPGNAKRMNEVRDALKTIAPEVGFSFPHPDGERSDKHRHVLWTLPYASTFGTATISLEVSLRPVRRSPRRAPLQQLLHDPLAGDYSQAYCWALELIEARAEKVRAACTRTAGRDFYDLGLLEAAGQDFESDEFIALVNEKLAELRHPPLNQHGLPFELTPDRRSAVEASLKKDLPAVVRLGESPFDLDALVTNFATKWKERLA
jgi:predicted nucleotidyltransferase component of viral defense system